MLAVERPERFGHFEGSDSLSGLPGLISRFLPARPAPRRLFLDDDPSRAEVFLASHPDAVWVQDVAGCVEKLVEPWDEVHLDHDLGGEIYVDVERVDCGMEVVRWLVKEPRKHLRRTRFTVHSHNIAAAFEMVMRLQADGFKVDARPFGVEMPGDLPGGGRPTLRDRARSMLRRLRGIGPIEGSGRVDVDPEDYIP